MMQATPQAIGICLGASTLSMVHIESLSHTDASHSGKTRAAILSHLVRPHDGDPRKALVDTLEQLPQISSLKVALTGRKFRHLTNLSSIAEPEAVEHALRFVTPDTGPCQALISAGGETFMVYELDTEGRIANVISGNKCAAGTGEFFLQQLRRMDVSLQEASQWAHVTTPYQVSGRCSVFCKSDCTHATNKGIPKSRVTAGLGKMMAEKILSLLNKVERRNLMLVGGTAWNPMMVHHLRQAIDGLVIPEQAPYFEALGAAIWALENQTRAVPNLDQLFITYQSSFKRLAPLTTFQSKVHYKTAHPDRIRSGDHCLLGLDVGSTTTKAVLIRLNDNAQLASIYLRTNGDPVSAARQCYAAILKQIRRRVAPENITITGLGICGSGRQIAGLHAQTDGVVNEIIAHATAALYYDQEVDTIIEIGGQDAKYTYIVNGVPADYAMNEACSAGTGSFLEESALETLGFPMEKIADAALKGEQPPNFNDQCAAFIASDIKNAVHEGILLEDIVAGLVYSICINYNHRVRGSRPIGRKIFMQGGVCYNKAIPLAMASLVDKPIVVPPEPGLMGAFGAALEVKQRLASGRITAQNFDLAMLADRTVTTKRPFTCRGGKARCDRHCEIARISVGRRTYPFGGACNRYDNLRHRRTVDIEALDLVHIRQKLIFDTYAPQELNRHAKGYRGRIGFNRSFLMHTYFPLYAHFFSALGFDPVLPDKPSAVGMSQPNAPFCFPGELSHGFFHDLLESTTSLDYLFLPHFKSIPSLNGRSASQLCPLVQGEPFYLQAAFNHPLNRRKDSGTKILSPRLDLSQGLEKAGEPLVATAMAMGISRKLAKKAFSHARSVMQKCLEAMQAMGRQALAQLKQDPHKIGVVLLARPYNGYAPEAHMGIPHKFASRGIMVIPLDFLNLDNGQAKRHMYWGMGQRILAAGHIIKQHSQLFGTYITNFSCGPDSFIINYARDLMGTKPLLTLELDSHTADAGLETRIEAFLDIAEAYRNLPAAVTPPANKAQPYSPARVTHHKNGPVVTTSDGRSLKMTDPRVTLLLPSMGELGARALAAAFSGAGLNARTHGPSNDTILKTGRSNTTCKECLPLILTTGTLIDYLDHHKQTDEVVVYFMPDASGPCRFGQYHIFLEDLICKRQISDVAIFSLSSNSNGYRWASADINRRAWWAIIISDVLEDIRAMLLANAVDIQKATAQFDSAWHTILKALSSSPFQKIEATLDQAARQLGCIPLKQPVDRGPLILLTGEIFVRRDGLSRQYLTERLARQGFATVCTPVAEWIHYTDYLIDRGLSGTKAPRLPEKLIKKIKRSFMSKDELTIKRCLSGSGLVQAAPVQIDPVIEIARPYISPHLTGEAILTVGSAIEAVATQVCGVIAIGPFGCMPNRLSEAILKETMKRENKLASDPDNKTLPAVLTETRIMPFLAVESDGSPFPQLQHARLEAFCLQAGRLHHHMLRYKYAN